MPPTALIISLAVAAYAIFGAGTWGYLLLRTGWPNVRSLEIRYKEGWGIAFGSAFALATSALAAVIAHFFPVYGGFPQVFLSISAIVFASGIAVFSVKRRYFRTHRVTVAVPKRVVTAGMAARRAVEMLPRGTYLRPAPAITALGLQEHEPFRVETRESYKKAVEGAQAKPVGELYEKAAGEAPAKPIAGTYKKTALEMPAKPAIEVRQGHGPSGIVVLEKGAAPPKPATGKIAEPERVAAGLETGGEKNLGEGEEPGLESVFAVPPKPLIENEGKAGQSVFSGFFRRKAAEKQAGAKKPVGAVAPDAGTAVAQAGVMQEPVRGQRKKIWGHRMAVAQKPIVDAAGEQARKEQDALRRRILEDEIVEAERESELVEREIGGREKDYAIKAGRGVAAGPGGQLWAVGQAGAGEPGVSWPSTGKTGARESFGEPGAATGEKIVTGEPAAPAKRGFFSGIAGIFAPKKVQAVQGVGQQGKIAAQENAGPHGMPLRRKKIFGSREIIPQGVPQQAPSGKIFELQASVSGRELQPKALGAAWEGQKVLPSRWAKEAGAVARKAAGADKGRGAEVYVESQEELGEEKVASLRRRLGELEAGAGDGKRQAKEPVPQIWALRRKLEMPGEPKRQKDTGKITEEILKALERKVAEKSRPINTEEQRMRETEESAEYIRERMREASVKEQVAPQYYMEKRTVDVHQQAFGEAERALPKSAMLLRQLLKESG